MTQRNTNLTTIEINKEVANLVHTYCVFNNLKMKDFVSQILEEQLKEFKERIKEMAKIKE